MTDAIFSSGAGGAGVGLVRGGSGAGGGERLARRRHRGCDAGGCNRRCKSGPVKRRLDHAVGHLRRGLIVYFAPCGPTDSEAINFDRFRVRRGRGGCGVRNGNSRSTVVSCWGDIGHIKTFDHAVLLQSITQIKPLTLNRWLENVEPAIKHDLPTRIRYNISRMG